MRRSWALRGSPAGFGARLTSLRVERRPCCGSVRCCDERDSSTPSLDVVGRHWDHTWLALGIRKPRGFFFPFGKIERGNDANDDAFFPNHNPGASRACRGVGIEAMHTSNSKYARKGARGGPGVVGKAVLGISLLAFGFYTVKGGFRASSSGTSPQVATSGLRTATAASSQAASEEVHDSLWKYTAKDIDGIDLPLSTFAGKVALVVNTATY